MIPGKQEPPSATVTPVAGFVIKARLTGSQGKLFVNIVGHNLVEAPHAKTLLDANNQQSLRIPLAVGEPALVKDNSGADCNAIDVIVNDAILKDATEADLELKQMIIEISLQAVANKYKLTIDEKSVTLPKLKYKGDVIRPQRIRIKKESEIQEVSTALDSVASESSLPDSQREKHNTSSRIPVFSISYTRPGQEPLDGLLLPCYRSVTETLANNLKTKVFEVDTVKDLDIDELLLGRICEINIPLHDLTSRRSVQLAINDDCLKVDFTGVKASYDSFVLWFPTDLLSDQAHAEWFDKTLKIRIPVN
jgi:hypothetical protein